MRDRAAQENIATVVFEGVQNGQTGLVFDLLQVHAILLYGLPDYHLHIIVTHTPLCLVT